MSTHVVGLCRLSDPAHAKKVAALIACQEAGVTVPKELEDYFGEQAYALVQDPEVPLEVQLDGALSEWTASAQSGFEVELAKVPEGVTHVRFYNAW